MRITKDTTLEQLAKLRKSFVPQWKTESDKIKQARRTLTGTALRQAETDYEWFETVATGVIVLMEQKAELERLQLDTDMEVSTSNGGTMDRPVEVISQRKIEQDTPDGITRTERSGFAKLFAKPTKIEDRRLKDEIMDQSLLLDRVKERSRIVHDKINGYLKDITGFLNANNTSQALHMIQHAEFELNRFLKGCVEFEDENAYKIIVSLETKCKALKQAIYGNDIEKQQELLA